MLLKKKVTLLSQHTQKPVMEVLETTLKISSPVKKNKNKKPIDDAVTEHKTKIKL